jgi:hypothetical protein
MAASQKSNRACDLLCELREIAGQLGTSLGATKRWLQELHRKLVEQLFYFLHGEA